MNVTSRQTCPCRMALALKPSSPVPMGIATFTEHVEQIDQHVADDDVAHQTGDPQAGCLRRNDPAIVAWHAMKRPPYIGWDG